MLLQCRSERDNTGSENPGSENSFLPEILGEPPKPATAGFRCCNPPEHKSGPTPNPSGCTQVPGPTVALAL
eukprot:9416700-Lingulodinium_polyedra.AAC.1